MKNVIDEDDKKKKQNLSDFEMFLKRINAPIGTVYNSREFIENGEMLITPLEDEVDFNNPANPESFNLQKFIENEKIEAIKIIRDNGFEISNDCSLRSNLMYKHKTFEAQKAILADRIIKELDWIEQCLWINGMKNRPLLNEGILAHVHNIGVLKGKLSLFAHYAAIKHEYMAIFNLKLEKLSDSAKNPKNIAVWTFYKEQIENFPTRSDREISMKFLKSKNNTSLTQKQIFKKVENARTYLRRGFKAFNEINSNPLLKKGLECLGTDLGVFPQRPNSQ